MLKVNALRFAYDRASSFEFPDIELHDGENLLILGESGIGKTTLLHLLAGLLIPQSGTVSIQGTVINQLTTSRLDKFRGKHVGLIFQRPHFIHALSLRDNLAMVRYLGRHKQDEVWTSAVLDGLGLKQKEAQLPSHLSIGEQQRANIAMAVINNPSIILADEPTSNLDDKNCQKVIKLLTKQARSTQAKLVIITHDQRLKNEFKNVIHL